MKRIARRGLVLVMVGCMVGAAFFADSAATTGQESQYLPVKSSYKNIWIRALPGSSDVMDREAVLVSAFSASPEAFDRLDSSQKRSAAEVIALIQAADTARVKRAWQAFVTGLSQSDIPIDLNSLIQWILRESYLETNKDLQFYADKVKHFNDLKESLRTQLDEARNALSRCMTRGDRCEARTIRDIEGFVERLEQELVATGDDAQLANIDLQNMLQRQQQTLQMMSQISKVLHDTAMAIIRKVG